MLQDLAQICFPITVEKSFIFSLDILLVEKSTPLPTQIHKCMQPGCHIQIYTLSSPFKKAWMTNWKAQLY